MHAKNSVGFKLLKIATLYMMAGLILGLVMGISHSLAFITLHSHISLLGWLTMAVTGLVYVVAPRCDGNRLAQLHFWLHNLGLPLMILGLVWKEYSAGPQVETVLGVGSTVLAVALLIFTINVLVNCRRA